MRKLGLITCKALEHNINRLKSKYYMGGKIHYIDAGLHNIPAKLNREVEKILQSEDYTKNLSALGLGKCCDSIEDLSERFDAPYMKVENCYHLFLGNAYYRFLEDIPGTYFVTNYLAHHFKKVIIKPLKFDIHPQLKNLMFSHYRRIIFIDTEHSGLTQDAKDVGKYLDLPIHYAPADMEHFEFHLVSLGLFSTLPLLGQTHEQQGCGNKDPKKTGHDGKA